MSKWTYIVYKKSGIQKDILAIQCQMLNLCNDTKPKFWSLSEMQELSYVQPNKTLI